MAGEETQAVDATPTTPTAQGGQEPPQVDKTFPAEYVQQLRQEAASYRTKLKEFEESQKKAEEERLAQQQEWQKLAEQRAAEIESLRPFQERYNAMLEAVRAGNEKKLEAIPETMKTLVPPIDDPVALGQWLDANWQILTGKPTAPSLNGGAGAAPARTTSVALTDAELQMAAKMGISAEDYAAAKIKAR